MTSFSVSQLTFGSVINPVGGQGSSGDGTQLPYPMGKGGDLLTSQAHGRFYQAAYRGNVFYARSPVAGSVIPIDTDTTAGHYTFAVLNPAGSGVNLELLQARVDIIAVDTYIASEVYLLALQGPPGQLVLGATCTPITGGVQNALVLQGNKPKSTAFSAISIGTSQADLHKFGLGSFDAVTTGPDRLLLRDLDGSVIVPPGTIITVAGNAAQTQIAHIEFMYAEVPI